MFLSVLFFQSDLRVLMEFFQRVTRTFASKLPMSRRVGQRSSITVSRLITHKWYDSLILSKT